MAILSCFQDFFYRLNVWFELGYAIASLKEVVLVCSSERKTIFPFDVQHRNITRYETESSRDFEKLKEKNIETQIGTYALHMHKAFNDNSNCRIMGDMSSSRYAFDHCLTLPLYNDMTNDEQRFVVSELLKSIA